LPVPASAKTLAPADAEPVSSQGASAHLLQRAEPVYPVLAKATHVQGVVRLELLIDEAGVVTPRVLTGHPMLAQAALDAVKQWKYKPFEREGKAIRVKTEVDVSIPEHVDTTDEKLEEEFQRTFWPAERASREALQTGDFAKADAQLVVALEAAKKRGDVKWLETAEIVSGMCSSKLGQAKFAEAEQNCHDALNIHENYQKTGRSRGRRCIIESRNGLYGRIRARQGRAAACSLSGYL
jgi:TonB family protein